MDGIPTFEGQAPDAVKFGFTGSVEMESDDEQQAALAKLGTKHAAYVVGMVEGAKYNFAVNKDGELVLTVTLKVLGITEDVSDVAKAIFHQASEEADSAEGDLFNGDAEADDLLDDES